VLTVSLVIVSYGFYRNIKRIIFYSLIKPAINEKGEKEMNVIPPATALQIAGRAGRYASQFIEGEVTTFSANDLPMLQKLLNTPVELIEVRHTVCCKIQMVEIDLGGLMTE